MLKPYLSLLMSKKRLTKIEAEAAMEIILDQAEPHQTAAFLAILSYRGAAPEEIAGMLQTLEKKARPVKFPVPVLDIVGTGGDQAHTVNISTGSAILAAACGIPIAKHGNRSVSSLSGAADVLEAFGIDIETPREKLGAMLQEVGIAFMFAPVYHPALKKVSAIRRGLKFPTVFNYLGPLLNPAKADYALIGVAHASALSLIGEVILLRGYPKRALVFHGCGLDELTTLGKSDAFVIRDGMMYRQEIDPAALGFATCSLKDLQGGDAVVNAGILKEVFAGKPGAVADALALNAGAAAWIYGLAPSLREGIPLARSVLQNGGAQRVLEKWINKE